MTPIVPVNYLVIRVLQPNPQLFWAPKLKRFVIDD